MHGLKMKYSCLLLFLWPWICVASSTETISCPNQTCGNVEVPYPFGIDDPKCAKNEYFLLECNRTFSPPTLFLGTIEVANISVQNGTINAVIDTATRCYNASSVMHEFTFNQSINLVADGPFTFSNTENKLVVIGCDTLALMSDAEGRFGSGCFSLCSDPVDLAKEGSCSSYGCCQTQLPKNLKTLNITLASLYNHSSTWGFNPCDFAFLVDQRHFDISKMRLDFDLMELENSSVLLDWVVENKTCEEAKLNISFYACGDNADCSYSENAQGYRCNCMKGYKGNPYLQQGCQDIDECKEPEIYPCEGKCKNKIGDYECKCPLGMHGDGKVGCQGFHVTAIASVLGACIFAVIMALFIFYDCKRRKHEKLFRENGGLVLKN